MPAERVRGVALKLAVLLIVKDFYFKRPRKQVFHGVLNVFREQALNVAAFEVVAAMQDELVSQNVNGFDFVKPRVNSGVGQRAAHLRERVLPYVRDGVQTKRLLFRDFMALKSISRFPRQRNGEFSPRRSDTPGRAWKKM